MKDISTKSQLCVNLLGLTMLRTLTAVLLLLQGAFALQLSQMIRPAAPQMVRRAALHMQAETPPTEPAADDWADSEGATVNEEVTGTFYDDEVVSYKEKPAVSDAMRKKLLNEQRAIGADSNSRNPFLFVFGGVGVFVLLGALAVNM